MEFALTVVDASVSSVLRAAVEGTSVDIRFTIWRVAGTLASALVATSSVAQPNDPHFDLQWGFHNLGQDVNGVAGKIGADIRTLEAWAVHSGTRSVTVAIVGRGVDPHTEFSDRLLGGHATLGDPLDSVGACDGDTGLAGVVAATQNNNAGIAGIHAGVKLLPVRVLDGCFMVPKSTPDGIRWAVDHGADIVLVPVRLVHHQDALVDAVNYAAKNDVLLIAPMGPTADSATVFPAAIDGCLAVAATNNDDTPSSNSGSGDYVDLAAPGGNTWTTTRATAYGYTTASQDTLAASAHVAGVAALVLSYAPQLHSNELAQVLVDSADDIGEPGWDQFTGAGRVNAHRALKLAPPPVLRFEPIEPIPATIRTGKPSALVIRIAQVAEPMLPDSARLMYQTESRDSGWLPLRPLGEERFLATLPSLSCGSKINFYMMALDDSRASMTEPVAAPGVSHYAESGVRQSLFEDDFETDRGWESIGGDHTSGRWERVDPIGSMSQPEFDRSPNTERLCFVTGQHFSTDPGTNDVDGGPVQLVSPIVDLPTSDAIISYARWFYWAGNGAEDFLTVEISRDGGLHWTIAEIVASTGAWVTHSFRLSEFSGVSGDQLRVRFSVADAPNDSLTDAAIDEFLVEAIHCTLPPGDANADGVTDHADYREMLSCWTGPRSTLDRGLCAVLDFDDSLKVDLRDFHRFQVVFNRR